MKKPSNYFIFILCSIAIVVVAVIYGTYRENYNGMEDISVAINAMQRIINIVYKYDNRGKHLNDLQNSLATINTNIDNHDTCVTTTKDFIHTTNRFINSQWPSSSTLSPSGTSKPSSISEDQTNYNTITQSLAVLTVYVNLENNY